MKTLRVQFVRGTALGGIGNDAYPGDLRTIPESQAVALVAAGRAVLVVENTAPQIAEMQAPAKPKKGR